MDPDSAKEAISQQEVYEAEEARTAAAVPMEIFQHGRCLARSRWL